MPEARLATGLWVSAYLRRLQAEMIPAYVLARGDDTAGAVLVKLAVLDGTARLFHRQYDLMTGARPWVQLSQGAEFEVDELWRRERARDPDLWVIEVESREGRHLLDAEGLDG